MQSSRKNLHRSGGLIVVGLLLVAMGLPLAASAAEMVTICHNGTTITVNSNAVYGRNGHLNDDGSAAPGHEGDHLGACEDETTTTTAPEVTTTTTAPEVTTTTAAPEVTTTTAAPEVTTTTAAPEVTTTTAAPEVTTTTLGVEVGRVEITTSTTQPTPPSSQPDPDGELGSEVGGSNQSTTTSQPAPGVETADQVVETLPFTGANSYLVLPGLILMAMGVLAVVLTSGFKLGSGGRHETR